MFTQLVKKTSENFKGPKVTENASAWSRRRSRRQRRHSNMAMLAA